jgi:hypothetical protein
LDGSARLTLGEVLQIGECLEKLLGCAMIQLDFPPAWLAISILADLPQGL